MTDCPICAQLELAIAIAARRDWWEAFDLRVQLADHQREHAQECERCKEEKHDNS